MRSAVAEYLNVFKGGEKEKGGKMSALSGTLHPALRRAAREIEEVFEDMIEEQGWFDGDRMGMILNHIPDEKTKDLLQERVSRTMACFRSRCDPWPSSCCWTEAAGVQYGVAANSS